MKWLEFFLVLFYPLEIEALRLLTLPVAPFEFLSSGKTLSILNVQRIVVDSRFADSVDTTGETLIPPSLLQYSNTFREDLESRFHFQVPTQVNNITEADSRSIFLTISNRTSLFLDAAGRGSAEGYILNITEKSITITGASPLGVWWGTRTLLQLAELNHELPVGYSLDTPGWRSRGLMLDAARHYYPPEFVVELCAYMSYFKQNQLHLHLSDNMFINYETFEREDALNLYSAFRLQSPNPDLDGLARLANESYTMEQFENIQEICAQRGVTIIPEIEAPAHALAIVRWKPELGMTDPTMLNLSHPETLPVLKNIWRTFLPFLHAKTVHIGADEYSSSHITDYTNYVNQMAKFIKDIASRETRIWGTFTPARGGNTDEAVTIQHWAPYEDNPYLDYIQHGYHVLNSDFSVYIVPKWSPYFGQKIDRNLIFRGNPDGGSFSPNIFDSKNATNNPPRNHTAVEGHIAPLWSDWGRTASTYLEAYWAWRDELPALADKQWGGDMTESEYNKSFAILQPAAPGQNLDRTIKSKSDLILEYKFVSEQDGTGLVEDFSGNGYHGKIKGKGCSVRGHVLHLSSDCYLETPLSSKGRDYTLSFWIRPRSSKPAPLFLGHDSALWSGYDGYGNMTMISGTHPYSLNYTLPLDTWTHLELIGKGNTTELRVSTDGKPYQEIHAFTSRIDTGGVQASGGVLHAWVPMAFEAPLERIGEGFEGEMRNISLREVAM